MEFQKVLLEVGKELSRREVKALVFLCTDLLSQNPTRVETAGDLFSRLADKDYLSPEKPELLTELLLTIQRDRLVRKLRLLDQPSTSISPYRKLLYSLSEEITDEELKDMKFLLDKIISRRKRDENVTTLEVFLAMEHMELISDTNLNTLETILKSVCPMLNEKINQFKAQQVPHSCLIAQETGRQRSASFSAPNQDDQSLARTRSLTTSSMNSSSTSVDFPDAGDKCEGLSHRLGHLSLRTSDSALLKGTSSSLEKLPSHDIKTSTEKLPSHDIKTSTEKLPSHDIKTSTEKLPSHDIKTSPEKLPSHDIKTSTEKLPSHDIKTSTEKLPSHDIKTSPETMPPQITTTNTEGLGTYSMTGEKRGICLIVNNNDFTGSRVYLKERIGTKLDEESLQRVFEWLGFDIRLYRDCSGEKMLSILKQLSSTDHSQMDCLVCCVLSHGLEGSVYGVDGQTVELRQLTNPFDGINCPSLVKKPKLFFIQACQGRNEQKPVCIEDDSPHFSLCCNDDFGASIPAHADFIMAMATVPSFVSFRETKNGTWFIQSLCQNLVQMVPRGCDLVSLLTKVNEDVSKKSDSTGWKKQMPQLTSSLRKKVIFPVPKAVPPNLTH
ncbi:caspase-8 isoform X2 [Embiotoca jacksoni]|uniref:caspase-8 isoform X2 n=1 Tax=Embiotoca jacksoni TaxID=100190 RepID=UPI00370443CE